MFLKILLCLAILIANCAPAPAQDKEILARLLKSEQAATTLISELSAYDTKSPWTTDVMWRLAQSLAVKGLKGPQISTAIIACGEMAAALEADDRLFVSVVLLTTDLLKQKEAWLTLYELEGVGVAAFDMLAEALRRPRDEVQKLARGGRLSSPKVFEVLTTFYVIRYKGIAEKLAIKRKGNQ